MKAKLLIIASVSIVCMLASAVVWADDPAPQTSASSATSTTATEETSTPPKIPDTPAAVETLVYARTFALEEDYKCLWRKNGPRIKTGTLLVLKVDPKLVVPRAMPMPVLYVGNQTAERLNHGDKSGYVIAIVPGEVDLTKALIWFGQPDLPDCVDAEKVKTQLDLANKAGLKPFSKEVVNAARTKGGEKLNMDNKRTLLREVVADLIEKYSPQEKNLASDFRLPTLKHAEKPKAPVKDTPTDDED